MLDVKTADIQNRKPSKVQTGQEIKANPPLTKYMTNQSPNYLFRLIY